MPGKKKKYNARFPPARIKKIMQSDEEVGKVAAPVPVIISRALELFAETLLGRAKGVTSRRGARTLTPGHLKFCIQSESRFDFLKDLVATVPDLQGDYDNADLGAARGGSEAYSSSESASEVQSNDFVRLPPSGKPKEKPPKEPSATGKKRGRPPKVKVVEPEVDSSKLLGTKPKKAVEKLYVDDEYDCGEMEEEEEEEVKSKVNGELRFGGFNVGPFSQPPPSAHQSLPFNRSFSTPLTTNSYVPPASQPMPSTPDFPRFGMHIGGAFHQAMPERDRGHRLPALAPSPSFPPQPHHRLQPPNLSYDLKPSTPTFSFSPVIQHHQPQLYSSTSALGHMQPSVKPGLPFTNGSFSQTQYLAASMTKPLSAAVSQDLDEDYDC